MDNVSKRTRSEVLIREAVVEDADLLGPNLGVADKAELDALHPGKAPEELLRICIRGSVGAAWAATVDDTVIAAWGVGPSNLVGVGHPWCLASDDGRLSQSKAFVAGARAALPTMQAMYPILTNIIDARNLRHKKWLKALGFRFLRRFKHTESGIDYLLFVKTTEDLNV